jgi:peptidoglycan/xylan/chitin deacetylase (PgdA/CDA1 family)
MHSAPAVSRRALLGGALALGLAACGSSKKTPVSAASGPSRMPAPPSRAIALPVSQDPKVIAARATVPVLCWHQLRDWRPSDTPYNRVSLICPPANFRAQLDAIQRSGHTPIDPDQYFAHLTTGTPLPPKPILLTFDDAQGNQITNGFPELQRRRMKATFFIMTVVLDKVNWMSKADLRMLDRAGMTIASHTYDHHEADKYAGNDWKTQLDDPRTELEKILGKPVRHFAYPYGAWNRGDFPHLQEAGYRTAFQLGDKPMDPQQPLLTLRRVLVNSTWTGPQLLANLPGSK